jgi:glycosyltransferase involved in cell wall biosynthesis
VQEELASGSLGASVAASSIRTIRMTAWRDLDDPEAGGSELHADRVASRWAAAGLDVELRTSVVPGAAFEVTRNGYRVTRRGGRYEVFAQVFSEGLRPHGARPDAVVEIWNGMPFFSPVWFHGPRLTILHHVHGEMWRMALSPLLAALGDTTERHVAPLLYRTTPIATLSSSSRDEIVERLHLPAAHVHVVEPGIDPSFTPQGDKSVEPLVVAVGRLVPVKRYDVLFRALADARRTVPALRAVVVGEGYERARLEAVRRELGAESWIELPGHVDEARKLALYRAAWLVASSSLREGWGMTLTEAAACATPAVATDIAGHRDAVEHDVSGLLVADDDQLGRAMADVLTDAALRERLAHGALARSARFDWARTAQRLFCLLDPEGALRASRAGPPGST